MQFALMGVFLALQFITCLVPFIWYQVVISGCTSSPVPVNIFGDTTMFAYNQLKSAGINVSWCVGQFISDEVFASIGREPLWLWVLVVVWSAMTVAPMLYFCHWFCKIHIPDYQADNAVQ